MDGTVLPELPELKLFTPRENVDAELIVGDWLCKLQKCFDQRSFETLSELFIQGCWWRDILALEWDFTTKSSQESIAVYLKKSVVSVTQLKFSPSGGLKPALIEYAGQAWVQAAFTFNTEHGKCRGLVRLENNQKMKWKAWTVFTELQELHFQHELEMRRLQSRAAAGKEGQLKGSDIANDVEVVIVGAGQAGVSLGARLKHMGIRAVLVERHPAVGDAWRARYDSVTLNTPTFTDHYPFMKYPESWPEWLTGNQAAEFLEHYSQLMGLEVLTGANVTSIQRQEAAYVVTIDGHTGTQTMKSEHVVLATGVYGDTPVMPQFVGQDNFKGTIYHSSQRKSGNLVPDVSTKRVVVIGCSTSGHDIAQDFANCGAKQISMVQRHPIFTLSTDSWKTLQLGLWNMDGLTTEEADMLGNSLPIAVVRTMSIGLTRAMAEMDKVMLDGLRKAGMALRTGEDGYGLADHQLIKGGHYYIDQGACKMIIEGKINVFHCEGGVKELGEASVTLTNGTRLDADVIVLATGFEKNIENVRKLLGNEIASQIQGFGDLDGEQERTGWWRPTGVKRLWYMTGSFMWCRQFSQALALQIAADLRQ